MTSAMKLFSNAARQMAAKYGESSVDTGRYVRAFRVARRRWRYMWDIFSAREKVFVVRERFRFCYGF